MPLRNVLIVGDFAEVNGGQAKVAIDSARLLADAGIQVSFFAASGPVSSLLEHPNIRTVCLDQKTLADNPSRINAMATGLWNSQALRALRQEIQRHDPATTVLHCHGWAKALSPSVGRALTDGRLPVLYTMHEYFLACPNGGFYDYRANEICTRKPLATACLTRNCDSRHVSHKVWRVARSAIAKGPGRIPRHLHDVAYISETQLRAMRPYLADDVNLHALPNPVATGGAKITSASNDTFVFVGRLSPEKGGLSFAKAAKMAGVPALFVGDGPEEESIREAYPQAEITGWVSPEEVQRCLERARALVFPSQWYECQPLVPIEALLRGIPVVCGSWTAASEVVKHGVNGILHDKRDIETLAESLRLVQSIGDFESSDLERLVSPENHLSRLLSIYEEMLQRRR